jgi:hypothetical protein
MLAVGKPLKGFLSCLLPPLVVLSPCLASLTVPVSMPVAVTANAAYENAGEQ